MEGVGPPITDPGEGGIGCEKIWVLLHSGCPGYSDVLVLDMGRDPCTAWNLGGIHHRVSRRITGKLPQCRPGGICNYPLSSKSMQEVRLEEMKLYIGRQHNMVLQYITTGPIMYLFLEAERRQGERIEKRWWENLVLGFNIVWIEG